MQRAIGILMLVIGIVGIVLAIAGIIIGRGAVDQIAVSFDTTLSLVSRSLDNVEATLEQTKSTVVDVNTGMDTAVKTVSDASQTIDATGPLLDQAALIVDESVPAGIEAIEEILANVAVATETIDTTVAAIRDSVGGSFLGVDLEAITPFQGPIDEVVTVLGSLSGDLRGMQGDLSQAALQIATISQDARTIADNVAAINADIAGFIPILDEYIVIVRETNATIGGVQAGIAQQVGTIKTFLTIAMLWIGITQIVPLYLGWELLAGRRPQQSRGNV